MRTDSASVSKLPLAKPYKRCTRVIRSKIEREHKERVPHFEQLINQVSHHMMTTMGNIFKICIKTYKFLFLLSTLQVKHAFKTMLIKESTLHGNHSKRTPSLCNIIHLNCLSYDSCLSELKPAWFFFSFNFRLPDKHYQRKASTPLISSTALSAPTDQQLDLLQ